MKVNKILFGLSLLVASIICIPGCSDSPTYVIIETEFGDMKIELYDSTPKHKENFIKLAKESFYDDLLFHRVISGFMVQGGDPNSRGAAPEVRLGSGGPGYQIDAEIGAPHFKGTLAAARTGDGANPERKSSGSQFYIVHGRAVSDQELNAKEASEGFKYNESQRAKYKEVGGAPMLDLAYTVFGEVVEGLEVVDKIAAVKTQPGDRPVKDVLMKIRMAN